jgi:hypothetical protein
VKKLLINTTIETPTVHCLNFAIAVQAATTKKAHELIRSHVAEQYSGTVTQFERATDIAKLDLNRYRYWQWMLVNISIEDLEKSK